MQDPKGTCYTMFVRFSSIFLVVLPEDVHKNKVILLRILFQNLLNKEGHTKPLMSQIFDDGLKLSL